MTFIFPYISPYVNLIWSTPANLSLANPSSFLFRLVNDDWNLIPIRTGCFFWLSSATCFFCFSLRFLSTASLKLSEVNLTILFCFPFLSDWKCFVCISYNCITDSTCFVFNGGCNFLQFILLPRFYQTTNHEARSLWIFLQQSHFPFKVWNGFLLFFQNAVSIYVFLFTIRGDGRSRCECHSWVFSMSLLRLRRILNVGCLFRVSCWWYAVQVSLKGY